MYVLAQECYVQCNMNTQTHYPVKAIWAPHVCGVLRVHDNSFIEKDCHHEQTRRTKSIHIKLKSDLKRKDDRVCISSNDDRDASLSKPENTGTQICLGRGVKNQATYQSQSSLLWCQVEAERSEARCKEDLKRREVGI